MKFARSFYAFFLLIPMVAFPQVGIGTVNVDPCAILQLESNNAAFILPRMTDAQMTAISSPLIGAMVFNSSENLPYFRGDLGWAGFDISSNPTIILSKNNGTFPVSPSSSYPMALTSANVLSSSSAYFAVASAGVVKVKRNGVYLMSVTLSTSNMPSGNRSYHVAVYLDGTLISYLSKSNLQNPVTDYWGTTGTLMYMAQAGQEFSFRYFIDYSGSLTNVFQTICITKLN